MIKKNITLLLTVFFLNGCKTKIICGEIKASKIKPLVLCDLSVSLNRCRCRCFDFNKWDTIADNKCTWKNGVFKSGDYPLYTCDKISGFFLDDMATEVKPKVRKLAKIKADLCN